MKAILNLKIGARLGLAFALVLTLATVVVAIGIVRLSQLTADLTLIGGDRVPKVQQLAGISDNVNLIAREMRNMLIWEDAAKVGEAKATVTKARDDISKAFDALTPTITSDEGKKRIAVVTAARSVYVPVQTQFVELASAGKRDEAVALLNDKLRPAQLAYIAALTELKDLQIELIAAAVAHGESQYQHAKLLMFGLLTGMVALGSVLGWWIARSIVGPIRRAVEVAENVAAGNLGSHIEIQTQDETGRLLVALQAMNESLVRIVGTVRNSSDSIATGSAQIASGNADLSQRTEQQASALQETAASMEQLGSTVRQNADNARQANQLAMSASTVAVRGGTVVGQVVETMKGINDSSKRIADIIGVIDGIAFQTNILSLNAAVEAARAGEQGRGFAVVASEVRNLAQRSAEAAKEIKGLIHASVERVEQGSVLVDQAGSTMEEVVNAIRRVTDIVAEISSASAEQSTGVSQVGEAVSQMDQVTQQNAALVEQSAAAADSLRVQAEHLVSAVGVFKLDGQAASAALPTAAAATPRPVSAPLGGERRGAARATNVVRPSFKPAPAAPAVSAAAAPAAPAAGTRSDATVAARTGTDDWEQF